MYSGRENPRWPVEDEKEARAILRELADNRSLVAGAEAREAEAGLGFRGLFIEAVSDEMGLDFDLPSVVWVPAEVALSSPKGRELLERLAKLATPPAGPEAAEGLPEPAQKFLLEQLTSRIRVTTTDSKEAAAPLPEA